MSDPQVILDYQTARLSIRARVRRALALLTDEIRRRKPWPAELLALAWVTLAVANVAQALRCKHFGIVYTPPVFIWWWAFLALAILAGGFYGLARQRRWRAIIVSVIVVVVTGVPSGAVQFGSCPHATYFQFAGLSFTVAGKACHNFNSYALRPRWMR
jgi:hypothetical protein